jgi:hypothetical protein
MADLGNIGDQQDHFDDVLEESFQAPVAFTNGIEQMHFADLIPDTQQQAGILPFSGGYQQEHFDGIYPPVSLPPGMLVRRRHAFVVMRP